MPRLDRGILYAATKKDTRVKPGQGEEWGWYRQRVTNSVNEPLIGGECSPLLLPVGASRDLVIVAGIFAEDMAFQRGAGGAVDGAGGD